MQNITPVHCFYVVFYILEFFSPIDRKKNKHLSTRSAASCAVSALPRVLVQPPSGVSDTADAVLPSVSATVNIFSYILLFFPSQRT